MGLSGLVALLLRQLLMLGRAVLRSALALLRRAFAAERLVPGEIPAAFLPRPSSLSRSPMWPPVSWKMLGGRRYPARRNRKQEIWAIKTPEPANPKVHRLWLDEHMRPGTHSSRVRRGEKTRTLRTSVGLTARTGTIARAVAKKVKTPPPPRRVQAPQKRDTRRAGTASGRPPWFYAALGALAVAVVAGAVIGFLVLRDDSGGGGGNTTTTASTDYNTLPGIRKTKAPWPPEYEFLADRLLPLGLQTLPQEAVTTHYHSHLDIFVDGKKVAACRR